MEIGLGLLTALVIAYGLLVIFLSRQANKLAPFIASATHSQRPFSVVIVYRDEAHNLPALLTSLSHIQYPKNLIELLFINDGSTDTSADLIHKWRLQEHLFDVTLMDAVRMGQSPKKEAITRALTVARFDWVVTTDADCSLPPRFFELLNNYLEQHPTARLVAGPVGYRADENPFADLQHHQNAALLAVTMAGFADENPWLGQGGNLCFSKNSFHEINGYQKHLDCASGDDVFLIQEMHAHSPGSCHYVVHPDYVVQTAPLSDVYDFLNQQIRWASKSKKYPAPKIKSMGLLVAAVNTGLVATMIAWWCGYTTGYIVLVLWAVKIMFDYLLMSVPMRRKLVRSSIPWASGWLYPWMATAVIPAVLWGTFTWKGSRYRS